jgi:ssDNA-binding Zn-finger/Zn-ribbon topoisomerase 1
MVAIAFVLWLLVTFENAEKNLHTENVGTILVIMAVITILILAIFIGYKIVIKKTYTFIQNHSIAIKTLKKLNSEFSFAPVEIIKFENSYDNEAMFDDLHTVDYLVYMLIYEQKRVRKTIEATNQNKYLYSNYTSRLKEIGALNRFDSEKTPLFKGILKRKEEECFNKLIQHPCTRFEITVTLTLTNINGYYRDRKSDSFGENTVIDIIERLHRKEGDFYLDEQVWQSICKVERAKVSNKMRFAVYSRDGNRCRNCGSPYDLEVDHIYPIAKGGKSTFDNLQTLCHRCNAEKSDSVPTEMQKQKTKGSIVKDGYTCPLCKTGKIVTRKGKYGNFYGCSNYPNCKFTKQP